jgi:hypothetical protein
VLVRSYRLGQQLVLEWVFRELARRETDPQIAFPAARMFTDTTFRYVHSVSEQVVVADETERESWLAQRNTMREAMLTELLGHHAVDAGAAEQTLGYRLRQHHLGAVAWGADIPVLEKAMTALAKTFDVTGQPLLLPIDRSWAQPRLGTRAVQCVR